MNESEKYFRIEHLHHDLKGRSVRGGAVTIGGQAAQFAIRLGGMAVLARLLAPEDFGLIAMVTALTGFVGMFKDAGLSMATVQRQEINHAQISTLFWINVALGAALMGITATLAPAVAWFYGNQELTGITLLLSTALLISGFAIQHQALLRRQMRFTALVVIEIIAQAVAIGVAIALAFTGFGYWALVSQPITAAATLTLLCWLLCDWRPGLARRGAGVRPMLAFGGNLTGSSIMIYFARNLDNIMIGRFIGAGPLGFYTRAYSLLMLPISQINSPVTNVAIPALSSLQDKPQDFRRYYTRALGLVVFFGFPLVSWLFVAADEVVLIVLGEKWIDSIPIFRMLAPAALAGVTNFAVGWVLIPLGQTGRLVRWNIFAGAFLCLCIIVGLYWGLMGVAAAISISHLLLKVPHIWYGYRFSPLRMKDFFRTIAYPFIASIIAAGLAFVVCAWLLPAEAGHVWSRFILISGFMLFFYPLMFQITKQGRSFWRSALIDISALFPAKNRGC